LQKRLPIKLDECVAVARGDEMNKAEEIRSALHQFLGELLASGSSESLHDDTPLRTSGLIDSADALRLIGFIEEKFNIEERTDETETGNLDRIGDIVKFVQRKQAS
jgi:acyl carrier protein